MRNFRHMHSTYVKGLASANISDLLCLSLRSQKVLSCFIMLDCMIGEVFLCWLAYHENTAAWAGGEDVGTLSFKFLVDSERTILFEAR